MGSVTLRPNGLQHNTGWVAVDGGTGSVTTTAANMHAFTSDDKDTTYVESPIGNVGALSLEFTTFAFPARSQIRSVAAWIRASVFSEGDDIVSLAFRPWVGDKAHSFMSRIDLRASAGIVTHKMGGYATAPSGQPWTQADVDQLRWNYARSFDWDRERPKLHELYAVVVYNEAPVVTLTGPVDEDAAVAGNQVTSTSTPTIAWTYTDIENDPQERVHIGVWPESVYSTWPAGFVPTFHFDPALRTPGAVWYEGPVLTSAQSMKVGIPLPNGNYEVWMQAADAGSNARYGAPASRRWTQAVPGPPAPSLAVAVDVATARVSLTSTANSTTGREPSFLRWEWSDGGPWAAVRGAERVDVTPGQTLVAYDREAPPTKARSYRARAGRVIVGEDVVGDASPTLSATQTLDSWWLKVLQDPTLNIRVQPFAADNPDLVERSSEQAGEYPVIGDFPVTVSAGFADNRFGLQLLFRSRTDLDAFMRNRALWRTVLVQSKRRQWYGRIMPDISTATRVGNVYAVEAEFSERRRPR